MLIRPATLADAERIAQIHVQAWQESYADILDPDFLRNISYEKRLQLRLSILSTKSSICHVAEVDGEVVGFCDVGKGADGLGELYALYVLEDFKRRQIGKALWDKAISYFTGHGLLPFHTWVLKDNQPARRFYEKAGGKMTKNLPVKIGEQVYDEVCYTFEPQASEHTQALTSS